MQLPVRKTVASDRGAIHELLDAAFHPSRYESRLRDLVVDGEDTFEEWVIEKESRIVGHILYTLARDGDKVIGYHLAPVCVHPEFQKQGIGSQLIRETLAMQPIAEASVFVLGDPDYYERFGFSKTQTARCPFDENNQHFRALRWDDDEHNPFDIGYASAFEDAAD